MASYLILALNLLRRYWIFIPGLFTFTLLMVACSEEMKSKAVASLGRLTGREVRASFHVDRSVIGGVLARVGDTIYDGSVRGRLARLRERFAGG